MASAPAQVDPSAVGASISGGLPDTGETIPPEMWFDRSSITADSMVTIQGVSEADWWKYAPDSRICEFFDGVVYMPSPATDGHQDELMFLSHLFNGFRLEKGDPIIIRLGPAVLRLAPGRNPEPDLFVIPAGEDPHVPPALLIIEVFSKSTMTFDRGQKIDYYREAKIPEILDVDLDRKRLIVHRLADDLYTTQIFERDFWQSTSVAGFWLDVSWLWEKTLPNARRCLERILAGPPA